MNKSTTNSLMVVGFFAVVIVASMMFVKKTEAYQNMGAPQRSLMAPMPSMAPQRPPTVAPMPPQPPRPPMGAPSMNQQQVNAYMNIIQRIDTSMLNQTRNVSFTIDFMTNTVKQRIMIEQKLRSMGVQTPPPPKEVLALINRIKNM